MKFLQNVIGDVVEHEKPNESAQFRALTSWFFEPPCQAEYDTEVKLGQVRLKSQCTSVMDHGSELRAIYLNETIDDPVKRTRLSLFDQISKFVQC